MIRVEQLSKTFSGVTALDTVDCEFRDGEITGLLGMNGAGKTTLMRIIYGLLPADQGRVLVDDLDVSQSPEAVRMRLGVLPDDVGLYKRLSARENIEYFGALHGLDSQSVSSRAQELISLLGMESIAGRRAEGFSLGERMKTALARALVHQPQHVLLDEPTNGLDVVTTRAVRRLLLSLRDQGRCVVFSSHLMHEVDKLCDRVLVIAGGRLVASGSVSDILQQAGCDNLEDAFVTLSIAQEAQAHA